MVISSRTPEGMPNLCPLCGNQLKIEPSIPPGDAPCPSCGHLLWFGTEDVQRLDVFHSAETRERWERSCSRFEPEPTRSRFRREFAFTRIASRAGAMLAKMIGA